MKFFIFTLLALYGCVVATVSEENDCKSNDILLTSSKDDAGESIATSSIIVNMKGVVGQLGQVGPLNVRLTLNDFLIDDSAWAHHITIVIIPIYDTIHNHKMTMVDQDVDSNEMELQSLLTDQELSGFVTQSTVEFDITITGALPSDTMPAKYNFCLQATAELHKGI